MVSARNILTFLLGALFIGIGIMKVSGNAPNEIRHEMKKDHFPFWKRHFPKHDLIPKTSDEFIQYIGAFELLGGISLFLPFINYFGNIGLIVIMTCAFASHLACNHPIEKVIPTAVLGLLLFIRFVLKISSSEEESDKVKEN